MANDKEVSGSGVKLALLMSLFEFESWMLSCVHYKRSINVGDMTSESPNNYSSVRVDVFKLAGRMRAQKHDMR